MLTLKIFNKNKEILAESKGKDITLSYNAEYNAGDYIRIESSTDTFIKIKFDEYLCESIIFIPGKSFEFMIPSSEVREGCYGEDAFYGNTHTVCASEITDEEAYSYRKISLNSHDIHGKSRSFPHTYANFVTREAPCFYARNAIDGIIDNDGHGNFPHHSWAGGAREDLEFTLDFGHAVEVDKVIFYLRADFPHDTYWKNIDVEFSDGSIETATFEMSGDGQALRFEPKETTYIKLFNSVNVGYNTSSGIGKPVGV